MPLGRRVFCLVFGVLRTIRGYVYDSSGDPVGISGVTVTLSGDASRTTETDANGHYKFSLVRNGNYTVTAEPLDSFAYPSSVSVKLSGADVMATSIAQAWSINGSVDDGVDPIAGVTVTLSGDSTGETETDANGIYSFSPLMDGSYTVSFAKTGYSFVPENTNVSVSGEHATADKPVGTLL